MSREFETPKPTTARSETDLSTDESAMTLRSSRGPRLSRASAAELRRVGPFGTGRWTDFDPDTIEYGMALADILEETGDDMCSFLEAAAVAGYSSSGMWEGVAMTMQAAHAVSLQKVDQHAMAGNTGSALMWASSSGPHQLMELLCEQVAELEERTAALHLRQSKDGRSPSAADRSRLLARRAERRAHAARLQAETEGELAGRIVVLDR